jgi:itaconate CoA-transferase
MNDNPAVESRPVDYVNDPRVIAQNDNVILDQGHNPD